MGISDIFSATDVILDARVSSKRNLLELLSAEAAGRLGRPQQEILDALQAREQIGSTALGQGVALPHAELRGTDPPVMLFVRLQRPVDFDARDDEPVDLVFLVLWPEEAGKGFLQTMSQICKALRDPQSLRSLRRMETSGEVVELMHRLTATDPDQTATSEES
jgi:PTS system nitrogen regulatory IIA component